LTSKYTIWTGKRDIIPKGRMLKKIIRMERSISILISDFPDMIGFCRISNMAQNIPISAKEIFLKLKESEESGTESVYRTNGVIIFIDYCTAPRDTQKGGRRRKRHSTGTRE
jgi:hypothetical protein